MTEFLETMVNKFTFKVATDRLYSDEGLWVMKEDGNYVRIGLSDFLQQRSGDVAFAEIKPEGIVLSEGDELGTIETIKVNIELVSPVSGEVVETNPLMELEPEYINQDPYGTGWLAVIRAVDWESESIKLNNPQVYFERMKKEAEEEASRQ